MAYWTDRNVFVTGATGLVGSHLVKRLVDEGADVVALVRDFVPNSQLFRNGYYNRIRRVLGDVVDRDITERIVCEYEVDTVFHLAAQTQVYVANKSPYGTLNTNIMGSVSVLEACRNAGVRRVVVSSSDKAYGDAGRIYTEDMALNGIHPYEVSKSCEDMIGRSYGKSFDMSIAVARCGNIYGAGDLNFSRLIPKTIRNIIRGKNPEIYGDGGMVRDYLYIDDCVDAYMLLGESGNAGAYNFSGEEPVSVKEIVSKICNIMGVEFSADFLGTRNEIDSQWLDITKAKTELGFLPKYKLADGLVKTIDWYKDFLCEQG
jgi:CDP-glucose 4,6-dehydratase